MSVEGGWSDIPGKMVIFVKDQPSPNWLKSREDLQTKHYKLLIRNPAGALNCMRNIKMHKLALLYNPIFDWDGRT